VKRLPAAQCGSGLVHAELLQRISVAAVLEAEKMNPGRHVVLAKNTPAWMKYSID